MAVRTDADLAARVEIGFQREEPIAEIRLRRRTKADDRAARSKATHLRVSEMRRMHETPARIDRSVIEQPFDWPGVADRQRILHFADLLGDVDVDRAIAHETGIEHAAHGGFRYCAQ